MELAYDLHIHSCLSPCGDRDMTPNNIVNMAKILGQDIIALTDHNSVKNCRTTLQIGKQNGLTVVPGMELCTSEEIHLVCLFPNCDKAEEFGEYIYSRIPPIKNRPDKFGDQLILDENDQIVDKEDILLITAADISIEDAPSLCDSYGGVCYPAHIDRSSFSILSALGLFPTYLNFKYAELSYNCDMDKFIKKNPIPHNICLIKSSDAHYLEDMAEKNHHIDLDENSAECLIYTLKNNPL